ncbi:uncharacterized protein L3040_003716 [Drepanopeziza brunnea f. sp. 'multigermtubi']|uniref:Mediator of RNA polymerase II transcription subunit 9 n=1 Tax=Marssonina brunnea f. sp. multigermtubi (strain MB_m1) TaxID=1072389 RepID=K1X2Y0_MARBU|nr:uncharacterized protein MBM_06844 [Drepanopeziza brunnea f. sp. 'multigermtubi' MB_m1]EKD15083.1 hypothetical protein MBM_06844 [Drepanopeziza brunnea f. sp. 'multigermtubi' MB_m1]KAJ5046473.1 hypothetical protein L3040_003716 [Drepanopeziza brunnea f. sp. 'multigermtubi']
MSSSTPQITSAPPSHLNLPEGLTPDSIDTLTVLSSILSRVDLTSKNPTASTAGSPPAATPSQPPADLDHGPLTVRDLPAATDGLKHNLQKAKVLLKQLPDLERSIKEQEDEMRDLEAKVGEQKAVLAQLVEVGASVKREREQRNRNGRADDMVET